MVNQILLYNAKVYLYPGEFAEAVLIRGSRIADVGTMQELLDIVDNKSVKYSNVNFFYGNPCSKLIFQGSAYLATYIRLHYWNMQ